VDTHYYETYNRRNVALIDINAAPITRITETGIEAGGVSHEFDDIVFATGFDAMTGALLGVDIKGRAGESLNAKWEAGPRTLLGIMTAGFPNMFMITGPGRPQQYDCFYRTACGLAHGLPRADASRGPFHH
jgi:cyclohexanone monooxygenase